MKTLDYRRFVIAQRSNSGYTTEKSLKDVFEQMGDEVIKIGPRRYLVIKDKGRLITQEVLIYEPASSPTDTQESASK